MSTDPTYVNPLLPRMVRDVLIELTDERIDQNQAVDELVAICLSVHANARGYGKMLGEETVLDAVTRGGLDHRSAQGWLAVVREKLGRAS